MKEENKKKINKLIIPFTRRTLSFLTATTMLITGTVGCKDNDNEKDTSSLTISISDDEIISSDEELTIEDSVQSNTNEESDIEHSNNNEVNNNTTSNDNKVNSSNNSNNKNNQTNNNGNSSDNQNNTSSVSTPSTTTPITPTMPSSLTASNINDVEVFKEFAKEIALDTRGGFGGIWSYTYNGQQYEILGAPEEEFYYVLAGLNIDYMNNESLTVIFEGKSLDDIKRYNSIISLLIVALDNANNQNNWDNLIIDKNILSSMKQIESAYLDYKNNTNKDKLRNLLNGEMNCDNPIVRRYFSCACQKLFRNDDYDNYKYNSLSTDLHFETKDQIEQFSIDVFSKIKNKTKVLN